MKEPMVLLSEDDYVYAREGNLREHYNPDVARVSSLPVTQAKVAVEAAAERRGLRGEIHPQAALLLIREIMMARYDAELERTRA